MYSTETYWVLFKSKLDSSPHPEQEAVVELPSDTPREKVHESLRSKVMPNKYGDPSDNLQSQRTLDCVLLNWKKIS